MGWVQTGDQFNACFSWRDDGIFDVKCYIILCISFFEKLTFLAIYQVDRYWQNYIKYLYILLFNQEHG